MAAIVLAVLVPASAFASAQGGWQVFSVDCPSGSCHNVCPSAECRMTRSDLTQSLTAWSVPSTTFGYEWIGVQRDSTTACQQWSAGCIVQVGYAKYSSSGHPFQCTSPADTTGGSVKILYYALLDDGTVKCFLGEAISANENHILKNARCHSSSSDWCSYLDGNEKHYYPSPGVGVTAESASVAAEFGCDMCMGSSTFIGSKWGAGTVGTYDWQVGDGTNVHTVTTSDHPVKSDHPTNCNAGAQWQINVVNPSIQWTIHWENGGVNC